MKLTFNMSKPLNGLEYSVNDGEWAEAASKVITFGGAYGNLRLRGKNVNGTAKSVTDYAQFIFNNKVNT